MWAEHYIFVPRINKSLAGFVLGWNSHAIRTASHHTPQQLFTSGLLLLQHSSIDAFDYFDDVDEFYGYDEEGPTPSTDDSEGVNVPHNSLTFADSELAVLTDTVNPTGASDEYGIDLYKQTLQYITTLTPTN